MKGSSAFQFWSHCVHVFGGQDMMDSLSLLWAMLAMDFSLEAHRRLELLPG